MTDPGAPASRPGPDPSARLRRWTWTIVGGYALVAALWIRFSDDALAALVPDRAALVRWGTAKGLFFVAVTATLLYALLRRALADLAGLEAARREMERVERFSEALVDSLPGVLYLYDVSGRFQRWNAAFERATGYSAEEIARMHPRDFFAEGDRPLVEARIAEVFATGASSVQAPFLAKDGTLTPYFFTGHRIEFDGRPCLVGVGIDISAQERASQELRRHAELLAEQGSLLRIAGRAARLGGWALELPARSLRWSDEVRLMHDRPVGYVPTLAEGLEHFVPEDRPLVVAAMERCEREGVPYDLELRKVTAAGRQIWVRTMGEAVRDAAGRVVRLQGAFQDITERKLAELRIREQAALLDKAQDAIVVRDLDHRVRYWNKSAERLYGWTSAEAADRLVSELFYRDTADFERAQATLLEKGEWVGEIEQRTKAGGLVTVEGHWTLVRDDSGAPSAVLAINTDITDRKALERQFLRAQRMESIGTLAGGIAHDLNNVLAPIVLSIDLLKHTVTDPESLESIEQIGASARRGAEMVRQVLSFARGMEGRRVAVQAGQVLHEAVAILRDTFPKSIRLVERTEGDLWPLEADPTQLQQVVINLCVNARDALPDGGEVAVSAENVTVDEHLAARTLGARVGPYVKIEVADNGTGIPAGIVDRIFEPFFTTKDTGKGTGLGLSTTQAIVKSHGGFIKVFSEPGAGSRFRLYFPAHPAATPEPAVDDEGGHPRGHGELVLLIDDEAPIRQVAKQTLEAFGYRVLLAADGTEGVRRFTEHEDEVAVVITDMMMPGLDGPATIEALRRVDPDVRIVGMSGITDHSGVTRMGVGSVREFLNKPFTTAVLLQALQRALSKLP